MEDDSKKNKKEEECQDLKNLQYKTMLMKGKRTPLLPKTPGDTAGIEEILEQEMSLNKNISWSRLDRSVKMKKLQEYAKAYSDKKNLTEKDSLRLSKYLSSALERNRLHKVKEVKYNKETEEIEDIPCLVYSKDTRKFTLKRGDKRVSTLSSLGGGNQVTRKKRGNRKQKDDLNDKLK